MTVKLKIIDATVETRSGEKDGRSWSIRKQVGWIQFPDKPFPIEVEIQLKDNQPPHAAGEYVINWGKSVHVNKFKNLEMSRNPVLELVKP